MQLYHIGKKCITQHKPGKNIYYSFNEKHMPLFTFFIQKFDIPNKNENKLKFIENNSTTHEIVATKHCMHS